MSANEGLSFYRVPRTHERTVSGAGLPGVSLDGTKKGVAVVETTGDALSAALLAMAEEDGR